MEVCERISNFIPHFLVHVITCLDGISFMLVKGPTWVNYRTFISRNNSFRKTETAVRSSTTHIFREMWYTIEYSGKHNITWCYITHQATTDKRERNDYHTHTIVVEYIPLEEHPVLLGFLCPNSVICSCEFMECIHSDSSPLCCWQWAKLMMPQCQ